MMGRYLYCQNTACGQYLGCSGGDSCSICGWCTGKSSGELEDQDEPCSGCGEPGCQGHCAGDDMMGDS